MSSCSPDGLICFKVKGHGTKAEVGSRTPVTEFCTLTVTDDVLLDRYKSLVTGTRARRVIAALWVLAFGIGLTPFLGWNGKDSATNCTEPWDGATNRSCCLVKCLFENVVPMSYMVYFNFFGCVLPPLLIMLVIYIKIFMVACRQLQHMELMDHSRTIIQREIHAAKSLAMIVGIFALCWLPLHAINCVSLFQPARAKNKPKWAMNTAILLSHANSVVNPVVYAYRNQDFRYTFHKIISRQVSSRAGTGRQGHSLPLMWAYDRGPGLFKKAHVHNQHRDGTGLADCRCYSYVVSAHCLKREVYTQLKFPKESSLDRFYLWQQKALPSRDHGATGALNRVHALGRRFPGARGWALPGL
ncbi:hypothetical protein GH733_018769 [Mirounga leonina]|nr:hypothetical protein GH733_018769 [Mirounga leonina]